jgi:predicted S18 family serine protease
MRNIMKLKKLLTSIIIISAWISPLIAACPSGTTAKAGMEVISSSGSCSSGYSSAPGINVTTGGSCSSGSASPSLALPTDVNLDTDTKGTWKCS